MKYIVLLVMVLLAGCAQPKVVATSEKSVVVEGNRHAWKDTMLLADIECKKFGLKASFKYASGGIPHQYFYDCVI